MANPIHLFIAKTFIPYGKITFNYFTFAGFCIFYLLGVYLLENSLATVLFYIILNVLFIGYLQRNDLSRTNLSKANLKKAKFSGVSLSEVNLSGANLREANFSNSYLSKAKLKGANLSNANFSNAHLMEAELGGANLSNANFSNAYLIEAELREANLSNGNFDKASLSKADLTQAYIVKATFVEADLIFADLSEASFKKANLVKSDLSHANLNGTDFSGAKLCEADLRGANFSNTNLSEANLSFANFSFAHLTKVNFSRANLRGANLSCAQFKEANFRGTNLKGADLRGANFRGINFSRADFRDVNLSDADLRGADLSDADFRGANLSGANLSGANFNKTDLSNANLNAVNAIYTSFEGSILTGVCIENWNINNQTNFENIICEYIYYSEGRETFQERRPHNLNKIFKPGDFAKLVEQSIGTVDLIFREGIDWKAFFKSFVELQDETNGAISIRAIENKDDGTFVIRLDVPTGVDKAKIEKLAHEKYERELACLEERYREQLDFKTEQIELYRQNNTDFKEIIKYLSHKPIYVNTKVIGYSQGDATMTGDRNIQTGRDYRETTLNDQSQYAERDINNYSAEQRQTLAEAAAEIQALLEQLEKTYPPDTTTGKMRIATEAIATIDQDLKLSARVLSALMAGGTGALDSLLNHPAASFVIAALGDWQATKKRPE
ncbi:pentapeptide repeat-containing protein [Laspinema sp. D1]|uniref:pentapeptide repeat-containing protein n=1 Tax=Laspinema palackyanum TaxID=3231601 RepID=UPI00347F546E|nr:pentapeptide repeat-containing protein [Laspinema sp. D2b]